MKDTRPLRDPAALLRRPADHSARLLNRITGGKLRPNAVTLTSLLLHLPVAWLIATGNLTGGAALLAAAAALDSLDGALARLQGAVTDFGTWLDASSDRLKEIIAFGALTYHLAADGQSGWLITLCTLALGGAVLVSYVKAKGEAILAARSRRTDTAKLNRIFSGGLLGYEWRTLVLVLALVSRQFAAGLLIIALGSLLTALQRTAKIKTALEKNQP